MRPSGDDGDGDDDRHDELGGVGLGRCRRAAWRNEPMARARTQPQPTPKESSRISRKALGCRRRWVTR